MFTTIIVDHIILVDSQVAKISMFNEVERTFSPHADLETFLEAAVLALVAMVLVDRAVPAAAARVCQVTANRALEEAFASFARKLPVVFAGALVAADDALHARLFSAIAAAAGSSEGRALVMVMVVMLSRRRVVVGVGRRAPGTVHTAEPDVGARLLQLVCRSRQTVD